MIETSEKRLMGPVIRLHPNDNVVVARVDVPLGLAFETDVAGERITSKSQVTAGYKIATKKILKGEPILKYSVTVGFAHVDIEPGALVHSHNTEFREFDRDYAHASEFRPVELLPESDRATFQGYVRPNGRVGTRNFIGILSTVNCSATVVNKIAEWFTPDRLKDFPNVDGVVAFSHSIGCGMEMTGEPMQLLRRTMAGYIRHPNLAAALVIGLGCERNQLKGLLEQEELAASPHLHTFIMQDTGGTRQTIAAGIEAVQALLPEANKVRRETVSASHSAWVCSAVAPTVSRRSPPTRRWARRSIFWLAMVAPASCRRRPRFMASSTR